MVNNNYGYNMPQMYYQNNLTFSDDMGYPQIGAQTSYLPQIPQDQVMLNNFYATPNGQFAASVDSQVARVTSGNDAFIHNALVADAQWKQKQAAIPQTSGAQQGSAPNGSQTQAISNIADANSMNAALKAGKVSITSDNMGFLDFNSIINAGNADYSVAQKMLQNMDISNLLPSQRQQLALRFAAAFNSNINSNSFADYMSSKGGLPRNGNNLTDGKIGVDDLNITSSLLTNSGQPMLGQILMTVNGSYVPTSNASIDFPHRSAVWEAAGDYKVNTAEDAAGSLPADELNKVAQALATQNKTLGILTGKTDLDAGSS